MYLEMDSATDVLSAIWSDTIAIDWTERLQINAPLGCWNPLYGSIVMDQSNSSFGWGIPEFELRIRHILDHWHVEQRRRRELALLGVPRDTVSDHL